MDKDHKTYKKKKKFKKKFKKMDDSGYKVLTIHKFVQHAKWDNKRCMLTCPWIEVRSL